MLSYNGQIISKNDYHISINNRAYRYGDGLFETIKVANGKIPYYMTHYSRMIRGIHALQMVIPDFYHHEYFHRELIDLLKAVEGNNGVIRMQVYRSGAGKYGPINNAFDRIIEFIPSEQVEWSYAQPKKTYHIDTFSGMQKMYSPISFFKSCNSQIYILAAIDSQRRGLDNVLLMNGDKIVEAISENIFLYREGEVFTPPITDGPVEGIMRSVVKKIAKWNKIPLNEVSITVNDLMEAEEVFLTNSVKGIIPVTSYQGQEYDNTFSTGLRLKLDERLHQLIV